MRKDNFIFKIIITVLISIITIIIILVMDYFNIFYRISSQLNSSFLEIIINNIVIITVFIVTYFLIDKRNMKKESEKRNNQGYVLRQLLMETYNECKKIIELLDRDEILRKYVVPKVDFNKTDADNVVIINLQNAPFEYDNLIMELFKEGIFSTSNLPNYLKIKREYQGYISNKISFFDDKELLEDNKKKIIKNLELEYRLLLGNKKDDEI